MTVENTSKRDPAIHVLGALADGTDGYITGMEAAGQRQLVNSDRLPTEVLYSTDAELEALGFTFGPADENDPMFRPATLPAGWSRKGSDHAMWSYIVDERGIERVAIFYKAAFYDRSAHMSVSNVGNVLASAFTYSDTPIPWDVLTDAERAQTVESLEAMAGNDPTYYKEQPAKAQAELELGLDQVDEFIHYSGVGPQPPGRRQLHSRRAHTFLCVFQAPARRRTNEGGKP